VEKKQILDSWKEICAYLKRSEKTCRKWEHELGLPIHRIEDSPKARVFAYKEELDRWMTETQHSEKKGLFGESRIKRFAVSLVTIFSLAIIAVIVWRPWFKDAPIPISSAKPSIAILPFVDLSPNRDQKYFCDGMTEELINRRSKVQSLRIPARTSSFSFEGQEIDIRKIGEELGVENVLEGSIRKAGNKLRITVQLVKVVDGYPLWSEKYEREMEDIFALQDEISLAIIDKLKLKLLSGERERLVKHYTENPETYNLYLKGLYFWNKRPVGIQKSREYFQRVIDKDPTYAPAYKGLASGYSFYGFYGFLPPKDAFDKAKILVEKALEIDDMLVEAHTSLAFINFAYDWDWDSAERGFKHALALNPNYSKSHQLYSMYLVVMRRFDEAIAEAKKALELEPLSLNMNSHLGNTLMWTGQYDKAIDQFHKTLEMDPNFLLPLAFLGHTYYLQGELEKAIDISQRVLTLEENMQYSLAILGICFADSGQTDRALEIINRFSELQEEGYVSPIYMFMLHSTLGDREKAFEYLEKAYVERDSKLAYMISIGSKAFPGSEKLRSDPRFIKIIRKMGLEKR